MQCAICHEETLGHDPVKWDHEFAHRNCVVAFDAGVDVERYRMIEMVKDDANAMTFQSLGQYRSALIAALRSNDSSHKPSMNGQQDTHPTTERRMNYDDISNDQLMELVRQRGYAIKDGTTECREPEDERLHMALEKLRASAARWDAIETLMILGDVDLTQEEDGGYCIYVEPVENILPTAWEGGTPHEAADKVVAQLATPNAELRPTCADLSRKVAP